jgi:hypothetical protein
MAVRDNTDSLSKFIVADITCDEAWLSITASEAPIIDNWR